MNHRPTPAIVSQAAVRALPRWAMGVVCLLFLLPGFLGRDPWRPNELAALAVMLDMAWLQGPWLQPEVLGQASSQWGLLPYWLGALSIQAFGWIDAVWAAKLPFVVFTALTLWATWQSTFLLALQPAAQPVSFAFGGEAQPKAYALALADGALLLLVACLGLALMAHEITVDTAKLSFAAVWLLGWVRWVVQGHKHSTFALWTTGSLGLSLSGAPLLSAVLVTLAIAASSTFKTANPKPTIWQLLIYALPVFVLMLALMQLGWSWPAGSIGVWVEPFAWRKMFELLAWFTWPAGILGLWALWKWRQHAQEAHILIPGLVIVGVVAASFSHSASDRLLLLGLPAFAVLGAFALPTLRRSVIALIDWFAVLFFTFGAAFIWVMWMAMTTGVPAKPAANVARLVPSFEPAFSWLLFIPAVAVSAAWIGMIVWRLGRSQVALWKPVVLSASGAMLCWTLLMTLWLPLLNHGMGLAPISQRIAQKTAPQACVIVQGLPDTYVGGLLYHGQLQVFRPQHSASTQCPWMIVDPSAYGKAASSVDWTQWTKVETLPRLRDNRDAVVLLQRVQAQ